MNGNEPYDDIYLELGNGPDALRNGADNYIKCSSFLAPKSQLFIDYIYS
jgi:hypothetical protein